MSAAICEVYLGQARTRSGTTIPHVAALMRATPPFNKKSPLALLHSDAGAAAILRDELDAGFLQGGHQSSPRFGTTSHRPILGLQSSDCRLGNTGGGSQIALRPRKQ